MGTPVVWINSVCTTKHAYIDKFTYMQCKSYTHIYTYTNRQTDRQTDIHVFVICTSVNLYRPLNIKNMMLYSYRY